MNRRSRDTPTGTADAPPPTAERRGREGAAGRDGGTRAATGESHMRPDGAAHPERTGRILRVLLSDEHHERRPQLLARDVDQAMAELAGENSFQPRGLQGPFVLRLALENGRLLFDIRDAGERPLAALGLAVGPFRRLMKDYLMIVDSHAEAAAAGHVARMEAIDMGRRGLHNEGAELIIQRLRGKIDVDFETARRLFTLVCVLHQRP